MRIFHLLPVPFFVSFCFLSAISAPSAVSSSEPPVYPDRSKLMVWRDEQGKEHPVRTAADWKKRRAHILAGMEQAMGPYPYQWGKVALDVKVTEEVKGPKWVRQKLTFAVEENDRVPAYLFIPRKREGKVPAILCLHQTTKIGKGEPVGLGGNPNLHYALYLAERGYVTLAPDYPSFGDYPHDFAKSKFKSGSMKAIFNNTRSIDLLLTMNEVDPEKIGCIGHSLGGHNTMFTMAFDERIKVGVSNCGFTSAPKYYKGDLRGWTSARYMPLIASKYQNDPKKIPFDFPEIVAAFAPRPFLASAPIHDDNFEVSGVKDCIAAALPVYELLGAKEKLLANYPDCKHDFPADVRKVAYDWLDRWLR
jgi:dienelactone hydrolase